MDGGWTERKIGAFGSFDSVYSFRELLSMSLVIDVLIYGYNITAYYHLIYKMSGWVFENFSTCRENSFIIIMIMEDIFCCRLSADID